jgi:hypothetical protein
MFPTGNAAAAYRRQKTRANNRGRRKSADVREIAATCPRIANKARRQAAIDSLETYCRTYKPNIFALPFSPDHRQVIEALETTINAGGQFALAMPRGSGKTSLAEAAAEWAILRGSRKFVLIICATKDHAITSLASLGNTFARNPILLADFPETCWPIHRLEGITQRRLLWNGAPIVQRQTSQTLILPNLPKSTTSSAILATAGLTGSIRGRKWTTPDGRSLRPDLVIIDDPQTDQTARSPGQTAARVSLIRQTVLGLAGPDQSLAAVMPCTVIEPDDLADQFLDHVKNPLWRGIRTRLVHAWPSHPDATDLWTKYADVRAAAKLANTSPEPENAFYAANRAAMDAGARVAWPERKLPDEISALQHAYNLRQDKGNESFQAEYQNAPIRAGTDDAQALTATGILTRGNGLPRRQIPLQAHWLTVGIDVQGELLYWAACAWAPNWGGAVVDYGTWPEQPDGYFTLANARRTLTKHYRGQSTQDVLAAGLADLTAHLEALTWTRANGEPLKIARTLCDCNWHASEPAVIAWAAATGRNINAVPSRGRYIGANSRPIEEWATKPGDLSGPGWRLPARAPNAPARIVNFDANRWKTTIADRLLLPLTARDALTLWNAPPRTHQLLADHCTAEFRRRRDGRGRVVDEWQAKPAAPDNHYWDCLVMSAVGASLSGCTHTPTAGTTATQNRPRRRVRYA